MKELDTRTSEFEQLLQKIASAIASGVFSERLPPSKLLENTKDYINRLSELATHNQESMLILKPEKSITIKAKYAELAQTLTTFKVILLQNTSDPNANSRLAFGQLKKALTDGSDFLFLTREIRDNPSPLISHILTFKELSETRSSTESKQAFGEPLAKGVQDHIEELNTELTDLEKKIGEIKKNMLELQERSMKILPRKAEGQSKRTENKTEKRQISLSNLKAEQN